jgi:hypothetical protein
MTRSNRLKNGTDACLTRDGAADILRGSVRYNRSEADET